VMHRLGGLSSPFHRYSYGGSSSVDLHVFPSLKELAVYKTSRGQGQEAPKETVSVIIGLGALLSYLVDRLSTLQVDYHNSLLPSPGSANKQSIPA
jgi:hypothetical protein